MTTQNEKMDILIAIGVKAETSREKNNVARLLANVCINGKLISENSKKFPSFLSHFNIHYYYFYKIISLLFYISFVFI